MFIVYFPLKIPIPMKQGEGVLYAIGVGIAMYNFKRDDYSVYSEPGFALHTPAGNKGMSIISKPSFQDLGFRYLAPPFVGVTDFWFSNSWAPNPRFRWFFLTRLKTFAQSQCSPTQVRTCLSPLCTVRRLSSPTTLSDRASLLASGTMNVPQSQACSTSLSVVVAMPSTTQT